MPSNGFHSTRGRDCHIPLLLLLLLFLAPAALSDTKGKLTGRVLDAKGEPVAGSNIVLVGTTLGAAADPDGYYVILNIPVGIYDVRISAVGYQGSLTKGVQISAGQTSTVNASLAEAAVSMSEVTTVAERPLVDTRQTSSVTILEREQISALPVQTLTDVVNLQAGVVDGHFRGGRADEVQYQVDGVSVNNPYDNTSVIQLDKSVLQEVQVISGTFDPEYGQAMSGVVNSVLRSGSEDHYELRGELYGGVYAPSGGTFAGIPTWHKPRDGGVPRFPVTSATFSIGGPLVGVPKTSFLVNVRGFADDGFLYGVRRFEPTDVSDFTSRIFSPTGDGRTVAMSAQTDWSGQLKIANRSLPGVQISYQAVADDRKNPDYNFSFRFNPDGQQTHRQISIIHGIDLTHSLSQTTFYTVSLRENYFRVTDYAFSALDDPHYAEGGAPRGDPNYELGATIQGYDLGRFEQKTNAFLLKASLTSQVTPVHLLKIGFEAQKSWMGFGAPGTLSSVVLDGRHSYVYVVADSLAQNLRTYRPITMAFFLQDRIEFTDFMLRGGIRVEYYDANTTVPSNLENPANAIQGAPLSYPERTTKKVVLAPRFGISYPITAGGALYFSYGHFYQMPGMGNLYTNSDYSILRNLQAGSVTYGVMGNPDIRPEFTTQYEFGFKQQFGTFLGLDMSIFYKDIRDLLGVEFVDTYSAASYARFTNVDFGSAYGVKLSVDQRFSRALSVSLNYTYQNAYGNSSDPRETATRAAAGLDPRPRLLPFDWDQRHTVNLSAILEDPNDYLATMVLKFGSGSPYTPAIGSGFGAALETNSARKPAWVVVDLRGEKQLSLAGYQASVFLRVFNLFDTRFENGFVFPTTGSPYYSLSPAADAAGLINVSRLAAPRRIELGLSLDL